MKINSMFVCLLISSSLFSSIPLSEAVTKALQRAPELKNLYLDRDTALQRAIISEKRKKFRVDFNARYTYSSDTIEIKAADFSLPDYLYEAPVTPNTILLSSPRDQFDIKVSLIQPIFAGGSLNHQVQTEKMAAGLQELAAHMKAMEITAQVKTSYLTYQLLIGKQRSLEDTIETLRQHAETLKKLYREDWVSMAAVLETEAKISEIMLNLEELNTQIATEKIHFYSLCGYLPEHVEKDDQEPRLDFQAAMKQAQTSHPMLAMLDRQMEIIQIQQKIILAANLPRLVAVSELHTGKPGVDMFDNEWTVYIQAGLNLSMPVFNWGASKQKRILTDNTLEKLRNQKHLLLQAVEKKLRQLFAAKSAIENKMSIARDINEKSETTLSLKEKLLREDQITNLEYLTSLAQLQRYRELQTELELQLDLLYVRLDLLVGHSGGRE